MNMRSTIWRCLLAMLLFPGASLAGDTRDLINKLAEAGRKRNNWVLPSDCQPEQNTVRQWSNATGASGGCIDLTGNDTEKSITSALEHPWIYRYGGAKTGELKTAQELLRDGQNAELEAQKAEQNGRQQFQSPTWAGCAASLERLRACAYRTAAVKRDAGAAAPSATLQANPDTRCAQDAVESANKALQDIDRRLGAFLASPAGQQGGSATPTLLAVMWGTAAQVTVMQQYCPKADHFKARADDLVSSYRSAEKACRMLQSRPEVCVPATPEALIANYDRARREVVRQPAPARVSAAYECVADPDRSGGPVDMVTYDPVTGKYMCEAGADARNGISRGRAATPARPSNSTETSQGIRK